MKIQKSQVFILWKFSSSTNIIQFVIQHYQDIQEASLVSSVVPCYATVIFVCIIKPFCFCFSIELLQEIDRLKESGGNPSDGTETASLAEVALLKDKLLQTQLLLAESIRYILCYRNH